MTRVIPSKNIRQLLGMALIFIAYFAIARLCLSLNAVNHFATLIWPPAAIAITALFLYGYELWPGVALGSFAVNLAIGGGVPGAAAIALGSTLQSLAAAYLLREIFDFDPMLYRLRDSFAIIIVSIVSTLIAPTIGTGSLVLLGVLHNDQFLSTWSTWWEGDGLGLLIFGPFLMRWMCRPLFTKTRAELVEGVLFFSALSLLSYVIFWRGVGTWHGVPLVYILLIPLIWAALRSGPRGTTLALVLMDVIALGSAIFGGTYGTSEQSLLLLQIFIGVLSVLFLLFVSIVEERKEAVVRLQKYVTELESALALIQKSDEAKSEFIATLAHELRNPLSPIVSSLELIKLNGIKSDNLSSYKIIETHTRTLARLLDDLLDISRISRKKFTLRSETVELQTIIHQSVESMDSFLRSQEHTLNLSLPPEPLYVEGDPVRLEQIFVNLLHNAAKYTRRGGKIDLTMRKEGGSAVVSIKDNGVGIPPAMLEQIFEEFVQTDAAESLSQSGLGIGLSLTRRLVELHRGTVKAQSEGSNSGSEFIVRLPLKERVPTIPAPVADAAPSARHHKVLVVDDNEDAARGLGSLLRHSGHEVALAHNGEAALTLYEHFEPRVVLLDIGLPGMDGYEVAQKIRSNGSHPVLIALTGYGAEEDKRKTAAAGFDHHLTKPVGIADVEGILARIS